MDPENETPEPVTTFAGSIWRHSRRYVIPVPKNQLGLLLEDPLGRDRLYKIHISVRPIPEINTLELTLLDIGSEKVVDIANLSGKANELIDKARNLILGLPSVAEISKLWKSGNKFIFPITPDTAELILPKIEQASKKLEEAIKLLKVRDVLERLLDENQEYQELKDKLGVWRIIRELPGEDLPEDYQKTLERMKAIEREAISQAIEKARTMKGTYKLRLLEGWIERPLTIKIYRFQPRTPEEAISLYRKTPIRLD
ncbi:hypothetical protein Metvu_1757 (plasmid) [Methanocaldococcus vulcanius M7]|uniref:Uncharacterized protein n=1 Tax=Methanocaldococcus vulcanius (strain ATCC 700851 / DSM 12094 / M7) TaxID=579137 RepID=C9RIH0_METVM|nr:SIMPL domain-containing protein [Methanocaldococcus vulcanius]ACX73607.1 hypothetical protein Metvu_1757 [Methanocaldococcus vulcanius M7]